MSDYDEIIDSLHKLADWVEKDNNVQCHSVPRKAAYLINAIEQENIELRLRLNKPRYTLSDKIDTMIGNVKMAYYLKFVKNKKKKK